MCGICGILYCGEERRVQRDTLAQMNAHIVHRGPDDDGFFVEGNVGLAMRRLSIIDIRTGQQPISNEDKSLWIVYNGEIYNHRELRSKLEARGHRYRTKSDTETIVHLYEEYGRDCVQHLRGMFAFAIWDRRLRRLFIARDRLGIKPLYYFYDDKKFIFGSEIKAILAYPGIKPEFNQSTLAEYLAFGYIAGQETMFTGICKLPPGNTLEIDDAGKIKVESYWDLSIPAGNDGRPRAHYIKTYRELLEECVASHLMSDVPLGVFLSVWPCSISLYFVARLARERVTVVLTGEGSDETLAGYTRYAWTLQNSSMDRVYRSILPSSLRELLRQGIAAGPLGASLRRKLE